VEYTIFYTKYVHLHRVIEVRAVNLDLPVTIRMIQKKRKRQKKLSFTL